MKPTSSNPDPLDDLLAAALHGVLTAAERAALDARLAADPAARAAHQEIQHMHDLLENNYRDARPDPAFEERMISGVRRKVRAEKEHRETAWESAVVLWRGLSGLFRGRRWTAYAAVVFAVCVVAVAAYGPITSGIRKARAPGLVFASGDQRSLASLPADSPVVLQQQMALASQPDATRLFSSKTALHGAIDSNSVMAQDEVGASTDVRTRQLESRLHLGKAKLLAQQGELQDSMKEFKSAAQAWPGNPDLNTASANFFKTEDRRDDRKQHANQSAEEPTVLVKSGEQETREAIRVFPSNQASAWDSDWAKTDDARQRSLRQFNQIPLANNAASAPSATGLAPAMLGSLPTGSDKGDKSKDLAQVIKKDGINYVETAQKGMTLSGNVDTSKTYQFAGAGQFGATGATATQSSAPMINVFGEPRVSVWPANVKSTTSAAAAPAEPSRKLVRDAQLDLEVKSYQKTVDAITALSKIGGGYLDSSNSQRGGNGKLQGSVVVKVLPENLDGFLLKLRDLGEIKNQSVSTEDVTKDYYDTEARMDNSRRMEAQLQELLKHDNGKVADLLQVERELGRVRGDIEQMQGQLKLYDFQVQYATVTIALAEKDLNQAAAYLLRENDQFSLFAHDVEAAFAQAKTAADASKAEILSANLQHNAGSDMSAQLAFSVPPDQIDGFLARVRALGRVENFTRQTQRVANDGGDTGTPADQTRTEKDRVQVSLAIRADDESPRQQTQLAIVSTGDIDAQAQQIKTAAPDLGAAVIGSNFQRDPDGSATATLAFRLPLAKAPAFMTALEKLGRVESLTVQRNDQPGQASADANAPAEINLRLHNAPALENEPPSQQTQLDIASTGDVDRQAQQVKIDAVKAGAAVIASSFDRAPDGTETAKLSFRLPLSQAADFMAILKKLGRVESLAVQRSDQPGGVGNDPAAPAQIDLWLHNQAAFVADDTGLWATLRRTFGHGIAAFLGSVQTIGVIVAFILPWLVALLVVAWMGRRIYVARKK
jgi:hypothetical protein